MNVLKGLKMSATAASQVHILMTPGRDVPEQRGNTALELTSSEIFIWVFSLSLKLKTARKT